MRLIDRDIVIQRIKDKAAFYSHETAGDFDTGRKLGLIGAEEVIADMPIIEAEPVKRGRWEVGGVCSECGFMHDDFTVKWFSYCPNCGARMDGEL